MIVFKGGRISSGGNPSGRGSGFGGLTRYLMEGDREKDGTLAADISERVAWVDTRNLDTEDAYSAAKIMRAHAGDYPRIEKPVYHFGLSLGKGEHLTREQWDEAIDRVLDGLGLEGHQVLVVAHGDTDIEHVHVVVNRVGEDGRAWNARQDMVKAYEVVHELEREMGLQVTGAREVSAPELSAGAYQEARRLGSQPLGDRVREQAGDVFANASSWRQLEQDLAERGFRLEAARNGSGVVITDGGRSVSLSKVDRELSGPRLAERYGETFRAHREREPEPPQVRAPGRAVEALEGTIPERAHGLVDRVTSTRATFTEEDLRRAAFYQKDSAALLREALRPEHAVDLGRDSSGSQRFTSRDYLEAEARLFGSAAGLAGRQDLKLEAGAVGRAVDQVERSSGREFSDEQRAAIYHATTGQDLAQIVGRAGAGKTTTAQAIAEAYRSAGYDVRGAALAGKAAEGLGREIGVDARTLASYDHAWKAGREQLHGGSVLLVDEAGMIDARLLGRVLEHAEERGAKVVLLGDPGQLKAIGAGDAYRGLLEQHGGQELATIRRQAEPWQREASERLAAGKVSEALDAYEAKGRILWADSREAVRAELVGRYMEAGTYDSALVVAYRNADVRALNDAIRTERQSRGELARDGVDVNGQAFAQGDRVVFLENTRTEVVAIGSQSGSAGVRNGQLATLEVASAGRFEARLDDGRRVGFDPQQYDRIAHGYAVTIHKSQGATIDQVHVLADSVMDRHAAYVALTRHRDQVTLYADRQTFGSREGLDKALSRASRKDLARDYGVSDIERSAGRLERFQEAIKPLRREEQSLKAALVSVERAEKEGASLATARLGVEAAAVQVYRDPTAAARAILADPQASQKLAAGQLEHYGELRGRMRPLLGADVDRSQAVQAAPALRAAVLDHRDVNARATRAQEAAAKTGLGVADIRQQLGRVSLTLRKFERAAEGPEKALEAAVRSLGTKALEAATRLLPAPAQLAVRAVAKVLSLGQELGR
jgi:Ti-type conjugative transfer relaxase TraA